MAPKYGPNIIQLLPPVPQLGALDLDKHAHMVYAIQLLTQQNHYIFRQSDTYVRSLEKHCSRLEKQVEEQNGRLRLLEQAVQALVLNVASVTGCFLRSTVVLFFHFPTSH